MAKVREYWRSKGRLPMWVSISMGRLTFMAEKDHAKKFTNFIVPYIEKELKYSQRVSTPKRLALGVSLGGNNILHLVLKNPKLFNSAFLVCPAISSISPLSSKSIIDSYIQRTGAFKPAISLGMKLLPKEFYHRENQIKLDPIMQLQSFSSNIRPSLFIQSNSEDEFGFQEGAKIFSLLASLKKIPHHFLELEGHHCTLKPQMVVEHLMKNQALHDHGNTKYLY